MAEGSRHAVAAGGDLNRDGYSDLALGGPFENEDRGRAVVYLGGPAGLSAEPGWVIEGDQEGQHLGSMVAMADLDGDGISDLVVSELVGRKGRSDGVASLHVFLGSTHGLSRTPTRTFRSESLGYRLRSMVVSIGDVNGDGCDDLAVVATGASESVDGDASLLVLLGRRDGGCLQPSRLLRPEQSGSYYGSVIAAAGDVNHDGYADLLVSAMKFTGRYQEGGKAYLHLGSKDGLPEKPSWSSEFPLNVSPGTEGAGQQFFGWGLGSAGDVNGDGYGDVLIGAWNASHGDTAEGMAFLYLGSAHGLASKPSWMAEGNQPHVHFGASMIGVGDLDGDGYGDVAIGVPYASRGQKDEGVVGVFRGGSSGLSAEPVWSYESERSSGRLGQSLMSAGDVNGDGVPDMVFVGADGSYPPDVRLRVSVVCGRAGGMTGGTGWTCRKPPLTALEQGIRRIPSAGIWATGFGGVVAAIGGLVWIQFRLKRRLAGVIEENRRLATIQERSRIARDMHDHLGADLTRLAAQIDRATDPIGALPLPEWRAAAHRAVETLDELVWVTNPRQDTFEGFANYLAEFVPSYLEEHGLECELEIPAQLPAVPLPARARHNLYLITKEVLHNIVKHSGAEKAKVSLFPREGDLCLVVQDDGVGRPGGVVMRPARREPVAPRPNGNGLSNMLSRAEELGGALRVERLTGGGVRVLVTVPLIVSGPGKNQTS